MGNRQEDKVEAVAIDTIRARERRIIDEGCTIYRALSEQIKELKAQQDEIMSRVKPALAELGHERIRGEGYLVTHVVRNSKKIDAKILLKKGVGQKIIDAATTITTSESWQVRGSVEDESGE